MKTTSLLLACIVAATLATTAFALTIEREITPDYVRQHPDEFSVSAAKGKDALIDFTVTHNVATPMYHVAHLTIYHGGKLIATSDTPLFGKKRDNKFHFSIAADDIAESKFSLSDSALDTSGEVPVPGTVVHQFRLSDFVPKELLKK
jgi:hypothetical protein